MHYLTKLISFSDVIIDNYYNDLCSVGLLLYEAEMTSQLD